MTMSNEWYTKEAIKKAEEIIQLMKERDEIIERISEILNPEHFTN